MRQLDEVFLQTLLQKFGIPIETWGTGKAQTIGTLLKEINEGETRLHIDNTGITRVIEIVKMHVGDMQDPRRGRLVEWKQIFPDSRERIRDQEPSEKIKAGETPEEALARGMREELEQDPENWWLENNPPAILEQNQSPSYPGLLTVYRIHHFFVALRPGSSALREEFSVKDPDGYTSVFRWNPALKS